MKKILWVLPKNTFPVNDGAKKANYSLLSSLSKLNKVDILVFNEFENNEAEYRQHFNLDKIFFIPRKKYNSFVHKLLVLGLQFIRHPFLPLTASFFAEESVKKQISTILKNQYEYIIFDGLHPYLGFMEFELPKIIYRAHNVESDLWFTKSKKTNNFLLSGLLNWQGNKIKKLELRLLNFSHKVWTIANEDKNVFSQNISFNKMININVGLDFEVNYLSKENVKNTFMFLGKLDWEPNKDGLLWFLTSIWPNVDKSKSVLKIAGSGQLGILAEHIKQEGIEFLGLIKDINEIYSISDCSIVPIQYGSGTRIKVIESVSKLVPIISSDMGVQGSGLDKEHYFHAQSEKEWIEIINGFDKKLGVEKATRAKEILQPLYDSNLIAKKALATLD